MPKLADLSKTIGIVGTRRRDTKADLQCCIDAFCSIYNTDDEIVSGGCPKGGDRFAQIIARLMGLTIIIHYPPTDGRGNWVHKGAGFIRNTKIAQDCDILIALVASDRTGGTEDTIRKCEKLGKEVIIA